MRDTRQREPVRQRVLYPQAVDRPADRSERRGYGVNYGRADDGGRDVHGLGDIYGQRELAEIVIRDVLAGHQRNGRNDLVDGRRAADAPRGLVPVKVGGRL